MKRNTKMGLAKDLLKRIIIYNATSLYCTGITRVRFLLTSYIAVDNIGGVIVTE